jgi:hypothetical protein
MPVPTMPGSESAMPNSQHRLLAPAIQQQATNEDILYEWIFDGTNSYWIDIQSAIVAGTTTVVLPFHPFLLSGM